MSIYMTDCLCLSLSVSLPLSLSPSLPLPPSLSLSFSLSFYSLSLIQEAPASVDTAIAWHRRRDSGKGKSKAMRAPLDQSMDRKDLLGAEDSCRGSHSSSNIESSMAVDVDGIAVDAESDDDDNAEPRGDLAGSRDAPKPEEKALADGSDSDDGSDDLSDDGDEAAEEDRAAATAAAPSGMLFWSGILDDDDLTDPGQKQPEQPGREEDGASCIKGAKEAGTPRLEPQLSNGGGASLGGFWSGILDGDDDCAPAKPAAQQPGSKATKGSPRVSSGANQLSGNDWDTASEASDGPEEPDEDEKPRSKQGSKVPLGSSVTSLRQKEQARDASAAPAASASGASSANFWEGILPADSIPAPTSNSRSGNEDETESLQSSDDEEWDSDTDLESSKEEQRKLGAAGAGAGPRLLSGTQAAAPTRSGQSNFWDGIFDAGDGTVVEEADAVTPTRRSGAARPALSLGRSSSTR